MRKLNKTKLFEFLDKRRMGEIIISVNKEEMTFEQVYRNNLNFIEENEKIGIYFFELWTETKKTKIKKEINEIFKEIKGVLK